MAPKRKGKSALTKKEKTDRQKMRCWKLVYLQSYCRLYARDTLSADASARTTTKKGGTDDCRKEKSVAPHGLYA